METVSVLKAMKVSSAAAKLANEYKKEGRYLIAADVRMIIDLPPESKARLYDIIKGA